jgi:hypothetical protein
VESSILKSTKKVLGLAEDYVAFDPDVTMHINAAFSILHQLGVGPTDGLTVEDESKSWADFSTNAAVLNLVKTYVYLKVRSLFDPPTMSYLVTAVDNQLKEYEWRLQVMAETTV